MTFVKILNVDFDETTSSLMDSFPVKEISTSVYNETIAIETPNLTSWVKKRVTSRRKRKVTVPKEAMSTRKAAAPKINHQTRDNNITKMLGTQRGNV